MGTSEHWSPGSWRAWPSEQQPEWPDLDALEAVVAELRALPPLVFAGESRQLRRALAGVAAGDAFLLHVGDCAESFRDLSAPRIRDNLKIMLQMATVLTYGAALPVVKLGRVAGQFAKPRSSPTERIGGLELPSFRGHIVNDDAPEAGARVADPARLLQAYHQSAARLNLLRAFTKGGFADLRQVHLWNLEFVAGSSEGRRYEGIARGIDDALRFMTACGIDLEREQQIHEVDLFTSHEGLILPYEEALTRRDSLSGDWYDCSAHLLWIGERTRDPGGAHVEFFSGVENPLACKIGAAATGAQVAALCGRLDPERDPGRLTLIVRLGADRGRGPPAAAHPRRPRGGAPGGLGLRPDARERPADARGGQDPPLRRHHARSCAASSVSVAPRASGRGACISSSRETTSRSASGAWNRCPRATSGCTTPPSATRGSTRSSRWTSPSRWRNSWRRDVPAGSAQETGRGRHPTASPDSADTAG